MKHYLKPKFCGWVACGVVCFLAAGEGWLRATPGLDASSPVSFFTSAANLFLQQDGYNFTVTNIPIYPVNCYTPAVQRLLQLAANIQDARTNRVFSDGSSAGGPYQASVFRPTFGVSGDKVFISGYVEEGDGATDYNVAALSLPEDAAQVNAGTVNIYGVPWVIGARKGFPNFNEFSMQSVVQITRKIQVVSQFATNVQYTIGISNVLGVEAWNSYLAAYPRAVDLVGRVELTMVLTNELGVLVEMNLTGGNAMAWETNVAAGQWAGVANFASPNVTAQSFNIPLLTNIIFLPDSVYHPNTVPHFTAATNFDAGASSFVPHFGLNVTNRLQFVMVDHLTGRVIDYVSLNGMNYSRDLTEELQGNDQGGHGGVWLTNLIDGQMQGVINQLAISEGLISISANPFILSDWITDQLPINALAGNSKTSAINAFRSLIAGATDGTMQAPFTPTRKVSVYCTWQANDPLVHYTLPDLTPMPPIATNVLISYWIPATLSNATLVNLARVNDRYLPWHNSGNAQGEAIDPNNYANVAVKDPLVTGSDAWNFPGGQPLNFNWLGSVHRGTPWQTFYLKSPPVTITNWQSWTGDTLTNYSAGHGLSSVADALLTEPTNDWALAGLLLPLLNPQDPHQLYSINQTDPNAWGTVMEGLTVLTNSPGGLAPLVIDATTNSGAIDQIVAGLDATRAGEPGGYFTNVAQLLAVPQLSVASPFLNTNGAMNFLSDAAYESLPSQLLALLRADSIGSVVGTGKVPQFRFTGFDGYAYDIQASSDLRDWMFIGTQYPTNGFFIFSDPESTNFDRRYYRAALVP